MTNTMCAILILLALGNTHALTGSQTYWPPVGAYTAKKSMKTPLNAVAEVTFSSSESYWPPAATPKKHEDRNDVPNVNQATIDSIYSAYSSPAAPTNTGRSYWPPLSGSSDKVTIVVTPATSFSASTLKDAASANPRQSSLSDSGPQLTAVAGSAASVVAPAPISKNVVLAHSSPVVSSTASTRSYWPPLGGAYDARLFAADMPKGSLEMPWAILAPTADVPKAAIATLVPPTPAPVAPGMSPVSAEFAALLATSKFGTGKSSRSIRVWSWEARTGSFRSY